MGSDPRVGAEMHMVLVPSPEWVERTKAEHDAARAIGIIPGVVECPRHERVAEVHLRAVLLVPLATVPQEQWPAFRVDMGQMMLKTKDGEVVPATIRLTDLEQRALEVANKEHPQLAAMTMRALAEAK